MELKPGDIIHNARFNVTRKITEVRPTGYSWVYPGVATHDFWSENSSDPFFELGWKVVKEKD